MRLALLAGLAFVVMTAAALASITIPVTYVGGMMGGDTVCSAQAVATANNINTGDEFERNDAKAKARAESDCRVANDILRNVTDSLNENFNDNMSGNSSHNFNRSFRHNLNKNLRGAMISF